MLGHALRLSWHSFWLSHHRKVREQAHDRMCFHEWRARNHRDEARRVTVEIKEKLRTSTEGEPDGR